KSFQFWVSIKDYVILICFAKRMEGNGHLGPEKLGSKVPKSPAKMPIANGQLLMHGDRMQGEFDFDKRSVHCAWNFDRTEYKEFACPIGVLAGLFGTL